MASARFYTALATPGAPPEMTRERIGYGAGRKQFPFPNVAGVTVGERAGATLE
jgi:uncharacterized protein (DUF111 family)